MTLFSETKNKPWNIQVKMRTERKDCIFAVVKLE